MPLDPNQISDALRFLSDEDIARIPSFWVSLAKDPERVIKRLKELDPDFHIGEWKIEEVKLKAES